VAIHHVSAMHPVAISRTILLLAIMHGLIKILLCQWINFQSYSNEPDPTEVLLLKYSHRLSTLNLVSNVKASDSKIIQQFKPKI
jgi:hypothetical protein